MIQRGAHRIRQDLFCCRDDSGEQGGGCFGSTTGRGFVYPPFLLCLRGSFALLKNWAQFLRSAEECSGKLIVTSAKSTVTQAQML
jgi:hypothetical protein